MSSFTLHIRSAKEGISRLSILLIHPRRNSAALQEGSFLHDLSGFDADGNLQPHKLGHFSLAIDIEHFIPLDQFKAITSSIVRQLHASRKAPGQERIYTAGKKECEMEKHIRVEGVPVSPNLQKNLKIVQEELGLTQYDFPV